MTMLPIDYLRRPWKSKYIDEETPEINQWFVFGGSGEECDISDGNADIFTRVPIDVAQEICEARNKFSQEIVRILNRDTPFDDAFDYSTGLPKPGACDSRETTFSDVRRILDVIDDWETIPLLKKKADLTYVQASNALLHLLESGFVEVRVTHVDIKMFEEMTEERPILEYRKAAS